MEWGLKRLFVPSPAAAAFSTFALKSMHGMGEKITSEAGATLATYTRSIGVAAQGSLESWQDLGLGSRHFAGSKRLSASVCWVKEARSLNGVQIDATPGRS